MAESFPMGDQGNPLKLRTGEGPLGGAIVLESVRTAHKRRAPQAMAARAAAPERAKEPMRTKRVPS